MSIPEPTLVASWSGETFPAGSGTKAYFTGLSNLDVSAYSLVQVWIQLRANGGANAPDVRVDCKAQHDNPFDTPDGVFFTTASGFYVLTTGVTKVIQFAASLPTSPTNTQNNNIAPARISVWSTITNTIDWVLTGSVQVWGLP